MTMYFCWEADDIEHGGFYESKDPQSAAKLFAANLEVVDNPLEVFVVGFGDTKTLFQVIVRSEITFFTDNIVKSETDGDDQNYINKTAHSMGVCRCD